MGRNQCKCGDTIPSSAAFLLVSFACFGLTSPLATATPDPHNPPLPSPHTARHPHPHPHLSFTVAPFRFMVVVHGSERNPSRSSTQTESQQHSVSWTLIWTCVFCCCLLLFCFLSLVLTRHSPSLLLSTHPFSNTHCLHAVLMSLCGPPIFFFPSMAPFFPSSIPLVSPTSSCLWKTPRQSCRG